jgi:hypothetical protein
VAGLCKSDIHESYNQRVNELANEVGGEHFGYYSTTVMLLEGDLRAFNFGSMS